MTRKYEDIESGDRFGSLVTLEGTTGLSRDGKSRILVRCDCGRKSVAAPHQLWRGLTYRCRWCGIEAGSRARMKSPLPVGTRVGFFEIVEFLGFEGRRKLYRIRDVRCGHSRVIRRVGRDNFIKGTQARCGCPVRAVAHGYVFWQWYKDGQRVAIQEHRIIIEREIGRPLASTETVHHINGNTLDNRPENLQLRSGRHGKGVVLQCGNCGSHDIHAIPIADKERDERMERV